MVESHMKLENLAKRRFDKRVKFEHSLKIDLEVASIIVTIMSVSFKKTVLWLRELCSSSLAHGGVIKKQFCGLFLLDVWWSLWLNRNYAFHGRLRDVMVVVGATKAFSWEWLGVSMDGHDHVKWDV
ncbi:hypothetical protein RYX36_020887 [Vicia faba]